MRVERRHSREVQGDGVAGRQGRRRAGRARAGARLASACQGRGRARGVRTGREGRDRGVRAREGVPGARARQGQGQGKPRALTSGRRGQGQGEGESLTGERQGAGNQAGEGRGSRGPGQASCRGCRARAGRARGEGVKESFDPDKLDIHGQTRAYKSDMSPLTKGGKSDIQGRQIGHFAETNRTFGPHKRGQLTRQSHFNKTFTFSARLS